MNPVNPRGTTGSRFNLSEWALHHRSLVLFAILMCSVFGVLAYTRLGQSEDPPFTFKVMVIRSNWPGAPTREVEQQLTDRIERKLQEVPDVDWVRSYSKPGESLVFFAIRDSAPAANVPATWYQVRKKIGDIRNTLPAGVQGPFFNDEFGDTYTNLYAVVGDGYDYRELRLAADKVRAEFLRVPGTAKVDFIGEQDEKIFVEMSNAKLATLGVEPAQFIATLAAQLELPVHVHLHETLHEIEESVSQHGVRPLERLFQDVAMQHIPAVREHRHPLVGHRFFQVVVVHGVNHQLLVRVQVGLGRDREPLRLRVLVDCHGWRAARDVANNIQSGGGRAGRQRRQGRNAPAPGA